MCGLVGIINKDNFGITQKDRALFTQMLYTDALRGFDSTGLFAINKHGNLTMIKSAQEASKFLETKTYTELMNNQTLTGRILIGHNRAATKGAAVDINAHPFIKGNTCLVHNGTLFSHKHLANVEVDSNAICHSIEKDGHKETIPELNGAFALIWYAAKEKRLYIARNKERPLWILQTPSADYIASEPKMLEWLYERTFGPTKEEPKYFETSKVYYYDLDNLKDGFETEAMPEKKTNQFLTTVKKSIGNINTKTTNNGTIGNVGTTELYKTGQTRLFSVIKHSEDSHIYTLVAEALDKTHTKACWGVPKYKLTENEWEDIQDSDVVSAEIVGESWKSGVRTLILKDVEPIKVFTSITGITILEEDFYEHCCFCTKCGAFIDPDEQDGLFWVRKRGNTYQHTTCMHCVAKHPHLSKHIQGVDINAIQESNHSTL